MSPLQVSALNTCQPQGLLSLNWLKGKLLTSPKCAGVMLIVLTCVLMLCVFVCARKCCGTKGYPRGTVCIFPAIMAGEMLATWLSGSGSVKATRQLLRRVAISLI